MLLLSLYTISFFLVFLNIKEKKNKPVYTSFILLYLFSSLSGIYIHMTSDVYSHKNISTIAVIFHILNLFLLLKPLSRFDKYEKYSLQTKNVNGCIYVLAAVVIFTSLFAYVENIPKINLNLLFTDAGELRNLLNDGILISGNQIIGYLNYYGIRYNSVALILAFYFMVNKPHKKALITVLLLCSLSTIVYGAVVAAREYIIKYILILLIVFNYFSPYLNSKFRKILHRCISITVGLFVIFFIMITVMRFNYSSNDSNAVESLFSYFGQGFINFSSIFNEFVDGTTGGKMKFPFFVGEYVSSKFINETLTTDLILTTFSTTIGSWCLDVGAFWTLIISIIHSVIFFNVGKGKFTVFKLIYIIWIYEFIFSALFFYNEILTGARLLGIFFVVLLDIFSRHKNLQFSNKI